MIINHILSNNLLKASAPPVPPIGIASAHRHKPDDDNDLNDSDAVPGPRVMASVKLAKVPTRKHILQTEFDMTLKYFFYLGTHVDVKVLAEELSQPDFKLLVRRFIHDQLNPLTSTESDPHQSLPVFNNTFTVYPSAQAIFYAPSDVCGSGGMRKERIRAVPTWYGGPGRYDTVFVETDADAEGMLALDVARVRLFFSFTFRGQYYPCAFVHWFRRVGEAPDEITNMWKVEPEVDEDGEPLVAILHLDAIVRAAHLIGVYGTTRMPRHLLPAYSLDIFRSFYVNKYVDHHAFEIAF